MKSYFPYDISRPNQVVGETHTIKNNQIRLDHLPLLDTLKIEGFIQHDNAANLPVNGFYINYREDTFYRECTRLVTFYPDHDGLTVTCDYQAVGSPVTADDMNEIKRHLDAHGTESDNTSIALVDLHNEIVAAAKKANDDLANHIREWNSHTLLYDTLKDLDSRNTHEHIQFAEDLDSLRRANAEAIQKLNTKVDSLDTSNTAAHTKFTSDITTLQNSDRILERMIGETKTELTSSIASLTATNNTAHDSMTKSIAALYESYAFLDTRETTDYNVLAAQITALTTANATAHDSLAQTQAANYADLSARIDELSSSSGDETDELLMRIATLETTHTNDIEEVYNRIDAVDVTNDFAQLKSKVDSLDTSNTAAHTKFASDINALQTSDQNLERMINAAKSELTSSIASLKSANDTAHDSITARISSLDAANTRAHEALAALIGSSSSDDTSGLANFASRLNQVEINLANALVKLVATEAIGAETNLLIVEDFNNPNQVDQFKANVTRVSGRTLTLSECVEVGNYYWLVEDTHAEQVKVANVVYSGGTYTVTLANATAYPYSSPTLQRTITAIGSGEASGSATTRGMNVTSSTLWKGTGSATSTTLELETTLSNSSAFTLTDDGGFTADGMFTLEI